LPAFGADGVQAAIAVQPLLFGVQVVVVQLLPEVGPEAVHEATPVGPVFTGVQVVAV
jgi:hypothetical protein